MGEVLTDKIEASPRWFDAMLRLFGKPAIRTSDRVKVVEYPSVDEQLTNKVRGYLKQMDYALDWQVGFWFGHYMDKAGMQLNRPVVIAVSQYDRLKTEFDAKVRRARDTQLI